MLGKRCFLLQVLHPSLEKGTLNAGLLSTEAGTVDRFAGNLLSSVAGRITGLDTAEEVRASPCSATAVVMALKSLPLLTCVEHYPYVYR